MQLEKEKAGERPSPGGDWLRVSRGKAKGVEGTLRHCSVLVEGKGEGRLCRDLDFLFYRNRAGGDDPYYFDSMYTDLVYINLAYTDLHTRSVGYKLAQVPQHQQKQLYMICVVWCY